MLSHFANQTAQITNNMAKLASDDQILNVFTKLLDVTIDDGAPP